MVFLIPTMGYKSQMEGIGFFVHLIGPLLALYSFCFLECFYPLSFRVSLLAILPVLLYGLVYLVKVVFRNRWEDFYGFNRGGKWKISFMAMMIGGFLVGMLFLALYRFA